MKHFLTLAIALPFLASPAFSQDTAPFSLTHYGKFQRMQHTKNSDGVVDLGSAVTGANLYGVGAPAHGTGEITVVDGVLWLDYGADGLGNAVHVSAKDEQAVLLVTAEVTSWVDVVVPKDMNNTQLQEFILAQASAQGIDTSAAFPFLLDGDYFDFDWHVLNGRKEGGAHDTGGLFHKVEVHRAETSGAVIGFYSAALQGVFTHPNESWHLHVIFEDEDAAGHVDAISVREGAILKLPVS